MAPRVFGAIDIGASGGRVMAGVVEGSGISLHAVHRFPNQMVERQGHLRWNITQLYDQVLDGIAKLAAEFPAVESLGIDTWGVDYGLLDAEGRLIDEPIAYRDERTADAVKRVHESTGPEDLYRINGLQFLPFTTLYQLEADRAQPGRAAAAHVVLLPDLLAYWLTGALRTEATNASTTGLVDIAWGKWSPRLLAQVGIGPATLPAIEQAGHVRGAVRPELCDRFGIRPGTVVTTVGSHDTASAVVGLPARGRSFAYVASGTWSLVGLELDRPVLSEASRLAGFSNEAGVDGRVRFLRNVGGLWLLQESLRSWGEAESPAYLATLLREAAALPPDGPMIDVDSFEFVAPGAMPERIDGAVLVQGRPPSASRSGLVRCVLDSLARAYNATIVQATALSAQTVEVIHVVGGGSQNDLLCQLTANATGLPVVAGPVEATALGNVMIQARTHGAMAGTLEDLRVGMADGQLTRRFDPGQPAEAV